MVAIDGCSGALHDGEHADEGQVDVEVGVLRAVGVERLCQRLREHTRSRGLDRGHVGISLRLGKDAVAVDAEQRVEGVLGHRRIENVRRKAEIERVHAHEVRIVHERGLGRVCRVDAVHRLLDVECGEPTAADDASNGLASGFVLEQSRALARADRAVQPRAEQ